jgi:hypothetical protein
MVFYHLMSALGYKTRWASFSSFFPLFFFITSCQNWAIRLDGQALHLFRFFFLFFVFSPHVGIGLQDAQAFLKVFYVMAFYK